MIRPLAVNCAPILEYSNDDGKTGVENTSDEMELRAVWALSEFSLLVSPQNHSDLSLKALDNVLKRFYQKKNMFREKEMVKSANANVDDLLATESHQLHKWKIYKICAAMEALVYGAEKVSTTKLRQFQVHLNRARQAATTWSDADCQNAIERLQHEIHQVTAAKCNLFDKLFQRHERQLLPEVRTRATCHRSKFTKALGKMKAAAEVEAHSVANMTADKWLQFPIHLSGAETEAMSWSLADTERVTKQLHREI